MCTNGKSFSISDVWTFTEGVRSEPGTAGSVGECVHSWEQPGLSQAGGMCTLIGRAFLFQMFGHLLKGCVQNLEQLDLLGNVYTHGNSRVCPKQGGCVHLWEELFYFRCLDIY